MRLRFVLAMPLALLAVSIVFAQETRSVILGRVMDPQHSAVAGASVIVTDTNTSVTLTTNDTGYYEANLLVAGAYRVTAQMAGFKRSIRSGIALSVGTRAEIDITLEIGETAENVSVTAEAPLVDPSSSAFL